LKQRAECLKLIDESGNDHERKTYNDIVSQEEAFMSTNSPIKIQENLMNCKALLGK
jgi:molecular chaperone DnaK